MTDNSALNSKTKDELIAEVNALRRRVADLEMTDADEEPRYSEANLRAILDNSSQSYVLMDSDQRVILVNRVAQSGAQRIFGRNIQPGDLFTEFLSDWNRDDYHRNINTALQGEVTSSERMFLNPMGEKRYFRFHYFPAVARDGEMLGICMSTEDITERKQVEEIQQKERNLLRMVIDILPDNIFVKDVEGHFLLNNAVSMEILGVTRQEELLGKTDFDLLPHQAAEQSREDELKVLESGQPVLQQEVFLPENTDKWRWLVYSTIPLRNEQGEIIGLVGMNHDITKRKLSEEAVRRMNRAYKVLSDCNQVMIRSKDEQSLLDQICHILAESGGYPLAWVGFCEHDAQKQIQIVAKAGTAIGYLERIYITWDDTPSGQGASGRAIRSGQPVMVSDIDADPNYGPWKEAAKEYDFLSSISLPLIIENRVFGCLNIYSTAHNAFSQEEFLLLQQMAGNLSFGITALRVEAERSHITSELQEREALLSAIVNSRVDLICRYTPDTILTFVNDAYCHFVGRSREDLIGRSFLPLTPDYEHADILARVEEVVFKREPESRERPIMVAGNIMRWVQWVDQAVVDNHGDLLIQAVGRDITAQKEAEDALVDMNKQLEARVRERTADLQAANERLEALSRVKDEFVSNVSHELRTPITSLTIREHLLRKNPERLDYHLEVMERETNRLRVTIEELLQLSRLDQKQTPLNLVPIDINAMVKRYVSDRTVIAETRNLRLAFLEAPNLPGVPADEGLLEQTLGILLTNAMNYTPAGGQITVKTVTEYIGSLRWVGFSVADNGPGISPKDQPRLFERFFRGETGRASGAPGTGLGLAIAKEIIERHSGKINIESSGVQGEGACFTVLLPEQT